MASSLEFGHVDSFDLRVVVLILEALSLKRILLHPEVVECADCVEVRTSLQFLELLSCFVEVKDGLHAIEVLSHVVLVLVHPDSSLNLILVHFIKL